MIKVSKKGIGTDLLTHGDKGIKLLVGNWRNRSKRSTGESWNTANFPVLRKTKSLNIKYNINKFFYPLISMNTPLESYFPTIVAEVKGFAIFLMDPNGIIQTWSMGCHLMKGYEADEAIGQNYRILFPDFLRAPGMPEKELEIAKEKGRFESENWRRNKSGELFWAYVVLTRLTDERGNLVGLVKITQDQSEKKKFQDHLHSKIAGFKKINSELTDFTYKASHDLKAPINNIDGLTLLVRSELEKEDIKNKEIYHYINMMHQAASNFKGIIANLALAAFEHFENYVYISFKEIVDEIKTVLIQDIKSKEVIFLEDYDEAPYISYPKNQIYSILQNLITNSIKYKSPLRSPEIKIKTSQENGLTLLQVSDNGIGIKEEDKNKVFVMYHRLEEGKKEEGTGVGLALVAKIVDGNHGKIEIESEPDKGTTFRIFLK